MGGIFISYRRDDSESYAGPLSDTLGRHFGAEQVFWDRDTIIPGERFPRRVKRELSTCDALLALIGPTWLAVTDGAGRRRLDDPDDWVHREIATVLARGDGVLVIPVLVGKAPMPGAADLPKPLAALADIQAQPLSHENWGDQVAHLTRELAKKVKPRVVAPLPSRVAAPRAEVSTAVRMDTDPARPIPGWLRRVRYDDTSRAALIRHADKIADAINHREPALLDQLRGGPDMVIDNLQFSAEHRLRSTAGDVVTDIGSYFRRQERRRMVVLGVPGAGKTVLAVRLLLDLVQHRSTLGDGVWAGEPVPVRINAAGWDGGADFTLWLSHQLSIEYGLNSRIAQAMVDSGLILPVLDGLDEMDPPDAEPERARVALDRLNELPWCNRPVVVMCRTGVFDRLREVRGDAGLHGATIITLQPLSPTEVCDHLRQYREQLGIRSEAWAPVTDQIGHDPAGALATALRTPWLLGLAATSLRRDPRTAAALAACRDITEIHDLLFGELIPAAIHARRRTGRTSDYTEQKVQDWMHTLAQHFERRRAKGRGDTEITLDEVWALAGTRRCLILRGLTVGLTWGTMLGLNWGFWGGPTAELADRLTVGLLYGPVLGLAFGLIFGLGAGRAENVTAPGRFAWRVPGRSRWRRGLMVGLTVWLGTVLTFWLGYWLWNGRATVGFWFGVGAGVAAGPIFGLVEGLRTNADDRLALGQDARRVIRDDLVAGLVAGLLFALPAGLSAGVKFGAAIGLGVGVGLGFAIGLAVGLAVGLTDARAAHLYAIASLVFAFTDIFPRRPAPFLEWARNAGLLRVTGIAYQCRHDTYQQWLAAGTVERGVKTTIDAQAG